MKASDFGLTPRDINTLFSIFTKYPEVKCISIFGSRAKGKHKFGSDIDLAILNEGVNDKIMYRIMDEIEESTLPYPTITDEALKSNIIKNGKEFYTVKNLISAT
jgi:predicted nucleotidyltransferase